MKKFFVGIGQFFKKIARALKKRRNKTFYTMFISQTLLVIQLFLAIFGLDDALNIEMQNRIMLFANGVLSLLGLAGVINDPKTPGMSDNEQE